MDIKKLIAKHRIITEQIRADELTVLLQELVRVVQSTVAGDVVELGCYEGTSALFLQRVLIEQAPHKQLWLYDSFEGLPDKTAEDISPLGEAFKGGELRASKARLERNFVKAGLPVPNIKRAWFYELDPADMPRQICFAFLDGDFYESIIDSFKVVLPHMVQGGVIVVDDYNNPKLPGAKKAVDELATQHGWQILNSASLAVIRT